VRHLLSHRSGLPDYTDQAILGSREEGLSKAWTTEELYEIVAGTPGGRAESADSGSQASGSDEFCR
jgi:CubicO group peptidase (beta-lactamase class C family)